MKTLKCVTQDGVLENASSGGGWSLETGTGTGTKVYILRDTSAWIRLYEVDWYGAVHGG